MHLLYRGILDAFRAKHADGHSALERREQLVRAAGWHSFADLRRCFASADQTNLGRQIVVTIFNIGGNQYRLLAEVGYAAGIVRILMILTHAEYDKENWKKGLLS